MLPYYHHHHFISAPENNFQKKFCVNPLEYEDKSSRKFAICKQQISGPSAASNYLNG
jgi:hypothetical protein